MQCSPGMPHILVVKFYLNGIICIPLDCVVVSGGVLLMGANVLGNILMIEGGRGIFLVMQTALGW